MIEVIEFVTDAGVSPFAQWRDSLEASIRARITILLDRVEHGNFSAAKGAGAGIYELRMDFGPGYRIYFGKDGEKIVILLGGGTKRRQQKDIEAAQGLWQIYKRSKEERIKPWPLPGSTAKQSKKI